MPRRGTRGLVPKRCCIDTSAWSRFRQADMRMEDHLAVAEEVCVPTIVLGELEMGFELGRRHRENRIALSEFLAEPWVRIVPVDQDVARRYGLLMAELRKAGKPIASNDGWIAATVMSAGAHLLTFDGDFRHIQGLDVTIFGR